MLRDDSNDSTNKLSMLRLIFDSLIRVVSRLSSVRGRFRSDGPNERSSSHVALRSRVSCWRTVVLLDSDIGWKLSTTSSRCEERRFGNVVGWATRRIELVDIERLFESAEDDEEEQSQF